MLVDWRQEKKTWIVYFCGKWERNENSKNEEKLVYAILDIYFGENGGETIVVGQRDREKESLARNGRLHRVAYTADMKRERFMGPQELCGT